MNNMVVAMCYEFKDGIIWDICAIHSDVLYMYISVN